ncbi:hypothetical protein HPB50_023607 [Hyalomma asiaticum]|uniref:Uncharacterized protein n=1 Tax=Hyalomma asiaticum TaxID=266040 RepID=A0ACB7T6C4_HYAAI|nr:hypothetical protein HPB50_023607 [Hyalomma asiaticum]
MPSQIPRLSQRGPISGRCNPTSGASAKLGKKLSLSIAHERGTSVAGKTQAAPTVEGFLSSVMVGHFDTPSPQDAVSAEVWKSGVPAVASRSLKRPEREGSANCVAEIKYSNGV